MKTLAALFTIAVLANTNAVAQTIASKPSSLLSITPSSSAKVIDVTGLYLVTIKCQISAPPEDKVNIFEQASREAGLTLTLSNARAGSNQSPAAGNILAAIPVSSFTLSPSPPPTFFKNDGCDQTLLIPGRTPLYLTAVWTDQQSHTPTGLTTAIEGLANLVAPLSVLFPAGPAALITRDAQISNGMATPFTNLVKVTDWTETESETTSELKETTYTVATKYFTKTGIGGSGKISSANTVSIAIKRISSMKDALSIPTVSQAYQQTIDTLVTALKTDPTQCIAIGRGLEYNDNYTHADAVSALAQIVVLSGIPSNKATTCLGKTYGPEVIQDSYWKQHSQITLSADSFPDVLNPIPVSPVILNDIAVALTNYAAGKHNNSVIDKYFAAQVTPDDPNNLTGLSGGSTMENILDKLKANSSQYEYYGCASTDAATDPNNIPDFAFVLAIDKSLKPENMLVMRMWWKLDTPGVSQPHIYAISILSDNSTVSSTLTTFKNQCGLGVKIPS